MNKYFIQSLAVVSASIIIVTLGWMFFQGRSFGAWGDDSPGYIYQAARFVDGEQVVYYSELADVAFEYFELPGEVRWLIPRHHRPLNRDGMIASKYPIGAGLLMAGLGGLSGSDDAFYLLMPITATGTLILTFFLAYGILRAYPKGVRSVASVLAMTLLAISSLFYEYAFSQPMRDIPATFFILIAFCALLLAKTYRKALWSLVVAAGVSYGISLNIRHTGIVIAPAFIGIIGSYFPSFSRATWKPITKLLIIFGVSTCVFLAPTVWNSLNISEHKISFSSSTAESEVVIASNIDHVDSLSIENLFNNQGKFRAGEGSLPHYWKVINRFTEIPLFLIAVAIGVISLWRREKWITGSFVWAGLAVIGLFALWVNPYSRYILPAYPFLAIFGSLGLTVGLKSWLDNAPTSKSRIVGITLAVGAFLVLMTPVLVDLYDDWVTPPQVNKSLTQADYQELRSIPNVLTSENPYMIMTGNWMYGLGEMMEGHDNIPHLRYPREKVGLEEARTFIEAEVFPRYETYVWMDSTTRAPVRQLITEHWELEHIGTLTFSFEPLVEIYAVKGPIN